MYRSSLILRPARVPQCHLALTKLKDYRSFPGRRLFSLSGVQQHAPAEVQHRSVGVPNSKEVIIRDHISAQPSPRPSSRRSKFQAYLALARLHAPVGTTLLLLPCAQSILLAGTLHHVDVLQTTKILALFTLGAFTMRSAGCVINDLWDRDLDREVERTASRPIASGEISVPEAFAFLGGLLSLGLGVLTQLNAYSIILGTSSMCLVIVYPLMKRLTYFPQLILGLAFNWGALLGYPALVGSQDWSIVLPLYTSGIFWTLIYDTIYAHQDAKDDKKVGIKSTALMFGDSTRPILGMLAVGQFGALTYLGIAQDLGVGYWIGCTAGIAYTTRILMVLDIKDTQACGHLFRRSQIVGWLIAGGIGIEYLRSIMSEMEKLPKNDSMERVKVLKNHR